MNVLRILAAASLAAGLACAVAPVAAHAEETVETTTTKSVETDVVERPALRRIHRHRVRLVRRAHAGCACRVVHAHRRLVRRGVGVAVRGYGPPVVSAAAIAAVDPWSDRAVDGRMVTPPIPGLIHDHDATADYLGKGGNGVPVLHLPSRRGVIDR